MESTDKVQIAKQAIKEIMEQDQVSEHKPTAKHLLFQLLSQLDSLQEEDVENLCPEVDRTEEKPKEQLDSSQEDGEKLCPEVIKTEEVIKEVKNVKRQNLVTQCLVSTMILLTVAWQISEMSMVLKVKNGLRNPLDFFGGIVKGLILKGANAAEVDMEQSSAKQKPVIKPPLIKFPDLPLLDLPIFDSSTDED